MKARLEAVVCLLLAAAAAQAQGVPETRLPPPFVPMWGERAFERQTVRGAPFSARTETELVQTLADGNRISGRWTGFVARDSAGRVRREQPLGAIGPLLAAPDSPRLTVIVDPVARATFFLDAQAKTARRADWPAEDRRGESESLEPAPVPGTAPSSEALGSREIAGIVAQGTRTTYVVPAGRIGNERPLSVVSERWSSADLGIDLETRHVDPRMGETRFRLSHVQQAEPEHTLFEVPSGYAVEDGPPRPLRFGAPPR